MPVAALLRAPKSSCRSRRPIIVSTKNLGAVNRILCASFHISTIRFRNSFSHKCSLIMDQPAKLALERTVHQDAPSARPARLRRSGLHTSMTGYQEVPDRPVVQGQIVTMTYPLIAIRHHAEDEESAQSASGGFRRSRRTRSLAIFRSESDSRFLFEALRHQSHRRDRHAFLVRRLRVRGANEGTPTHYECTLAERPGLMARSVKEGLRRQAYD